MLTGSDYLLQSFAPWCSEDDYSRHLLHVGKLSWSETFRVVSRSYSYCYSPLSMTSRVRIAAACCLSCVGLHFADQLLSSVIAGLHSSYQAAVADGNYTDNCKKAVVEG